MKYYGFKSVAKFPRSNSKWFGFANGMAQVIKALFANNEQGFAFDFNDLSTMYQDSAGTIPVTSVGQPVGRVLDKSGRGNHATQTTSSKRPILQKNATTGAYYLSFDGVDDFLTTNSVPAMGLGTTIFSGSFCNKVGVSAIVARGMGGYLYQTATQTTIQSMSNGISIATSGNTVTTALYDPSGTGATLRANKQVGTKPVAERGFNNTNPLIIGAFDTSNTVPFQGNIYSVIGINRVATSTEIINTENIIAKTVGVTL